MDEINEKTVSKKSHFLKSRRNSRDFHNQLGMGNIYHFPAVNTPFSTNFLYAYFISFDTQIMISNYASMQGQDEYGVETLFRLLKSRPLLFQITHP